MSRSGNTLDPSLDVTGSLSREQTYNLADEAAGLGHQVSGQVGAAASVTVAAAGVITISGLTGMTTESPGRFLGLSGGASPGNNGLFLILEFIDSFTAKIANPSGVAPDGNNGSLSWIERHPYSLEDDLNYARTDRAAIKGTDYHVPAPTYERPTAVGTPVLTNLSNIADKTTDARAFTLDRKVENV